MEQPPQPDITYGKTKWPLWQWLFILVVLGVVIFVVVYYFFFSKKPVYNISIPKGVSQVDQTVEATPTNPPDQVAVLKGGLDPSLPSNSVYMVSKDTTKGNYLTDSRGMTLYVFYNDTIGVSYCYGDCQTTWKPYIVPANPPAILPKNITIISRRDLTKQFAWEGKPLYYFIADTKAGQISGDGSNGFSIIK